MDIVRPEQRPKGECDPRNQKRTHSSCQKKRGKKHGSLLSGEPVGEENVKIIDDKSPPVLQGK